MNSKEGTLLRDLNSELTCPLCSGYYVDATTLVDCMHSFCKSCILRHFENSKLVCPTCNTPCKKKENSSYYKQDMQLQTLVYKIVPGLYSREIQRREEFYRTAGVRASSSCSDDSVIGDNMEEHEEWVHTLGDDIEFLSPDDMISLSLEYYQQHLDTTNQAAKTPDRRKSDHQDNVDANANIDNKHSVDSAKNTDNIDGECKQTDSSSSSDNVQSDKSDIKEEKLRDRRYLNCPAAVSMKHLQKFIRKKYALTSEHKVDIIHNGEVLPPKFTLMDVAYTFKWKRVKPMRFFYRIFTPMKIRPIRIINTSCSGQKQLQIVPVNSTVTPEKSSVEFPAKKSPTKEQGAAATAVLIDAEQNSKEKERLMAELQLQSKAKMLENAEHQEKINARYGRTYERNPEAVTTEKRKRDFEERLEQLHADKRRKSDQPKTEKKSEEVPRSSPPSNSVFDYEDPDEELKIFAEKRDREWQMVKHPTDEHRPYKKRKKNKHSKSEKRKMHAEITSEPSNKQEPIKLKVKLTPHNGHKHSKHNKSSNEERKSPDESSSKEKLRQMRQIRHKSINSEEVHKPIEDKPKQEFTVTFAKTTTETQTRPKEVEMKSSETQTKPSETQATSKGDSKEKRESLFSGKTLRSDFTIKTSISKEISHKQAVVQTEKLDQAPKPLPRTAYTKTTEKPKAEVGTDKKVAQSTKSLQQQILRLQTHCSVKSKEIKSDVSKQEKKVTFSSEKPHILNSQYTPGFTVSKIEAGVKKKQEITGGPQDKRPSLEITLINPTPATTETTSTVTVAKQSPSTGTKRPLPATIPLEKIKAIKNIPTLPGVSIIPTVPEKCDNIGALDLSKSNRSVDSKIELNKNGLNPNGNGLKSIPTTTSSDKGPLSNLQMLSKVATEHPNINKPLNIQNKPRQQMPSLQNIKIPSLQQQNQIGNKPANLAKIPKLNEITKGQFRMTNSPRTVRPNQNQNIRNIPNPSLLVRQQNQNRMNSLNLAQNPVDKEAKSSIPTTSAETSEKKQEEQKTNDKSKCDITVSKT